MFCRKLLVKRCLGWLYMDQYYSLITGYGQAAACPRPQTDTPLSPLPKHTQTTLCRGLTRRSVPGLYVGALSKSFNECNSMWIMCERFKYFKFLIKGYILHCFHDIFVFGPAQLDVYILTDGALPLPAHFLFRIIANVKLVFWWVFFPLCYMYRLHKDLLCCISTYVDLVISNL